MSTPASRTAAFQALRYRLSSPCHVNDTFHSDQVVHTVLTIFARPLVAPQIPPYARDEERAADKTDDRWQDEHIGPFDRDDMRENVLAGDGTEEFFDMAWRDFLDADKKTAVAFDEEKWSTAGGALFYIVAGRVPTNIEAAVAS